MSRYIHMSAQFTHIIWHLKIDLKPSQAPKKDRSSAHDSSPFIYVKSWSLSVSQSIRQKHLRATQRSCKTTEVLLGQRSRSFGNHEECLKIMLAKFLGCTFEFHLEQKSNSLLFNQLGVYTKVGWGFTYAGVAVTVLPICIYTLFWLTSTLMVWLNWDNKIMILTCEACSGELTGQMNPKLIRRKSSLRTSLTTRWTKRWLGKTNMLMVSNRPIRNYFK